MNCQVSFQFFIAAGPLSFHPHHDLRFRFTNMFSSLCVHPVYSFQSHRPNPRWLRRQGKCRLRSLPYLYLCSTLTLLPINPHTTVILLPACSHTTVISASFYNLVKLQSDTFSCSDHGNCRATYFPLLYVDCIVSPIQLVFHPRQRSCFLSSTSKLVIHRCRPLFDLSINPSITQLYPNSFPRGRGDPYRAFRSSFAEPQTSAPCSYGLA